MTTAPTATKDQAPLPGRANRHTPGEDKPPPGPPLPVDLATLSDAALARYAKAEAELFELVRERAAALGVTPARLAAALVGKSAARSRASGTGTDGRSVVKPKFWWCPKDHSVRWSGRGGQTKWFAGHLAAGGTEEECLIPEGAL